jgi:Concanavalin A-like lectin/glucanases superfamily
VTITTPYDSAVQALSPTVSWRMNDAAGSSSITDWTGNGHTGVVVSQLFFGWAGPLIGYALAEPACLDIGNGSASSATVSIAANPAAVTLIAWFNTANLNATAHLFGIQDSGPNAISLSFGGFTVVANSGGPGTTVFSVPNLAGWHMAALTISGSTVSFYLDGELQQVVTNNTAFTFGSSGTPNVGVAGNASNFSGVIAQCALWASTALTAAQILSLYQAAIPSTTLVPKVFNVSLGGRPYTVADAEPFYREYRRQLEPLIRTQADTSNLPGEQSMDPNGLWRRSIEDWRNGANQRYLDRAASVNNGYWTSKGVDTLTTAWQISQFLACVWRAASCTSSTAAAGYSAHP